MFTFSICCFETFLKNLFQQTLTPFSLFVHFYSLLFFLTLFSFVKFLSLNFFLFFFFIFVHSTYFIYVQISLIFQHVFSLSHFYERFTYSHLFNIVFKIYSTLRFNVSFAYFILKILFIHPFQDSLFYLFFLNSVSLLSLCPFFTKTLSNYFSLFLSFILRFILVSHLDISFYF